MRKVHYGGDYNPEHRFSAWDDNYPPDDTSQARMALAHDLMRGLKGGRPFWLMEQTPSHTASRDVNPLKRPGCPSRLVKYLDVVMSYHNALWQAGTDLDVIPVTAELTPYEVVVAPALRMVKGDLATRLEAVAERGGSVLTTFLTTVRVSPGNRRIRFILNHRAEPVEVPAVAGGTDLLTGATVDSGQTLKLEPYGVLVLEETR